jgi:hypothetical protein
VSSYVAVELDALNKCALAARSAGVSEDAAIAGQVRLWAHCFREKTDRVTAAQLRGVTSVSADVLEAFGFLAADGDGWRVKGADRYLRIAEGRSRGGKMASGNLKKGTKRQSAGNNHEPDLSRETSPAPSRLNPGSLPAEPRLDPGLSPTTDYRLPKVEKEDLSARVASPRKKGVKPTYDPEWQPLVDTLTKVWSDIRGTEYTWSPGDFAQLKALRKRASPEEIVTRWARGIVGSFSREVNSVAQLANGTKWNALSTADTTGDAPRISDKQIQHKPTNQLEQTWVDTIDSIDDAYVRSILHQLRVVGEWLGGITVGCSDQIFAEWCRNQFSALLPPSVRIQVINAELESKVAS